MYRYSAPGFYRIFHCPSAEWAQGQKVDEIHIPFSPCHAYGYSCSGMEAGVLQAGFFKFISFPSGGNDRLVGGDT